MSDYEEYSNRDENELVDEELVSNNDQAIYLDKVETARNHLFELTDSDASGEALANEVFGFHQWSLEVRDVVVLHSNDKTPWNASATCIMRMQLADCFGNSYRESVGCGKGSSQDCKDDAILAAISDAEANGAKGCFQKFSSSLQHQENQQQTFEAPVKSIAPKPSSPSWSAPKSTSQSKGQLNDVLKPQSQQPQGSVMPSRTTRASGQHSQEGQAVLAKRSKPNAAANR